MSSFKTRDTDYFGHLNFANQFAQGKAHRFVFAIKTLSDFGQTRQSEPSNPLMWSKIKMFLKKPSFWAAFLKHSV